MSCKNTEDRPFIVNRPFTSTVQLATKQITRKLNKVYQIHLVLWEYYHWNIDEKEYSVLCSHQQSQGIAIKYGSKVGIIEQVKYIPQKCAV